MIVDATGIELIPGNQGKDCPGNGRNPIIECCCNECDYFLCCMDETFPKCCKVSGCVLSKERNKPLARFVCIYLLLWRRR